MLIRQSFPGSGPESHSAREAEALADSLLGDPGLRRRCLALPDCDVQLQGRSLMLIFREEITDPPLLASTLQLLCDLAERVEQIALPDTSPALL